VGELNLELLAVEERILGLLDHWRDKAKAVGDADGLSDLGGSPLGGTKGEEGVVGALRGKSSIVVNASWGEYRGEERDRGGDEEKREQEKKKKRRKGQFSTLNKRTKQGNAPPVQRVAVVDDPVEGTDSLFKGRSGIVAVSKDNVDVVELETLQRRLGTLDDVLARVALLVGVRLASAKEDCEELNERQEEGAGEGGKRTLGGNDELGAVDLELLEDASHLDLGLSVRVDLGVVCASETDSERKRGEKEGKTASTNRRS
jgi:hypothetical protein